MCKSCVTYLLTYIWIHKLSAFEELFHVKALVWVRQVKQTWGVTLVLYIPIIAEYEFIIFLLPKSKIFRNGVHVAACLSASTVFKSYQIKNLFVAPNKNQCRSYINNNIIINDVVVQKGSGEAMLVKFPRTLLMINKIYVWGHLNRCNAKNVWHLVWHQVPL